MGQVEMGFADCVGGRRIEVDVVESLEVEAFKARCRSKYKEKLTMADTTNHYKVQTNAFCLLLPAPRNSE